MIAPLLIRLASQRPSTESGEFVDCAIAMAAPKPTSVTAKPTLLEYVPMMPSSPFVSRKLNNEWILYGPSGPRSHGVSALIQTRQGGPFLCGLNPLIPSSFRDFRAAADHRQMIL